MKKRSGTLLFVSCYQCSQQITRVISQFVPELAEQLREIVIVDNQSSDNTAEIADVYLLKLNPKIKNIRVVKNPLNMGLGGTHKMAFEYATEQNFSACIILHGDDQGSLKDFETFLSLPADFDKFIFGSRFDSRSKLVNYSRFRTLGNLALNILASLVLKRKITDFGGAGLNYFPVTLLENHNFWQYADDLTFHAFLLSNAIRLEQQIVFHPISWREADQISNVRLFGQTTKLIKILFLLFVNHTIQDKKSIFKKYPGPWL